MFKLHQGSSLLKRILCRASSSSSFSKFVSVADNIKIFVQCEGSENEEAIVCLPGALGSASTDFEHQLKGLSKEFSVIGLDPRGYGKSQTIKRDFPVNFLERDADDAVETMKVLGFKKFHVMGWSDGANSASILAGKYPEVVDRLILISGNAFITDDDMECYDKIKDIDKWSSKMRNSLASIYGDDLEELWSGWHTAMKDLYSLGGDISCSYLPRIQCKTLVVQGKLDPLVPNFHAEYLNERILHSKLLYYPEGKHNVHMRYAEEFNKNIIEFLREDNDRLTQSREYSAVPSKL